MSTPRVNTPYGRIQLYSKVTFGKYKGMTIADIIDKDLQYADWMFEHPLKGYRRDNGVTARMEVKHMSPAAWQAHLES